MGVEVSDRAAAVPGGRRRAVARWISIIGHPFSLAVLLALVPAWAGGRTAAALRVTAVVLAVAVVPLTLFVRRQRARGRWDTVDASRPADRPALFKVSVVVLVLLGAYFAAVERSPGQVRATVAALAMVGVAAAVNRWVKLSLHVAFAALAAWLMVPAGPAHWVPLVAFLPLLAWSRLALGRHTVGEVVAGLCLGGVVGMATLG